MLALRAMRQHHHRSQWEFEAISLGHTLHHLCGEHSVYTSHLPNAFLVAVVGIVKVARLPRRKAAEAYAAAARLAITCDDGVECAAELMQRARALYQTASHLPTCTVVLHRLLQPALAIYRARYRKRAVVMIGADASLQVGALDAAKLVKLLPKLSSSVAQKWLVANAVAIAPHLASTLESTSDAALPVVDAILRLSHTGQTHVMHAMFKAAKPPLRARLLDRHPHLLLPICLQCIKTKTVAEMAAKKMNLLSKLEWQQHSLLQARRIVRVCGVGAHVSATLLSGIASISHDVIDDITFVDANTIVCSSHDIEHGDEVFIINLGLCVQHDAVVVKFVDGVDAAVALLVKRLCTCKRLPQAQCLSQLLHRIVKAYDVNLQRHVAHVKPSWQRICMCTTKPDAQCAARV